MAITSGQTTTGTGSGNSIVLTAFSNPIGQGNQIVVVYGSSAVTSNNITSITDTYLNSYSRAVAKVNSNTNIEIWYATNTKKGALNIITVNVTTGSGQAGVIAREYLGLPPSGSLDKTNAQNNTSTTSPSSGPVTTTISNSVIVGGILATTSPSVGTGFSNFTSLAAGIDFIAIEDKVVDSTGTYNATFITSSSTSEVAVATFGTANPGSYAPGLFTSSPRKLTTTRVSINTRKVSGRKSTTTRPPFTH